MPRLNWMLIMLAMGCGSGGGPAPDGGLEAASLDAAADAEPIADAAQPDTAPDLAVDQAEAGLPARLVVAPSEYAFFGAVGCQDTPVVFRVTNAGDQPSGPVTVVTGDDFPVTSDSCQGTTLPGGASCTFSVGFFLARGDFATTTLSVQADPGGTARALLRGSADSLHTLSIHPSRVEFGASIIGQRSDSKAFELRNTGGRDVQIEDVKLSMEEFLVTSDGCGHRTLAPNASCRVDVAFSPKTLGAKFATERVTGIASGCSIETAAPVELTGTGVDGGGAFAISPAVADFGDSCSSKPIVFKVSNFTGQPVGPLTTQLNGGAFSVTRNECTGTLAPGKTCEVEVRLDHTSFGKVNGVLTVSGAAGSIVAASLTGMIYGPSDTNVILSAPIPDTRVGQTSAAIDAVLSNPAGAPPAKFTWNLTGVSASEYTVTAGDCNQLVPGGGSCRVHIVFAPTGTGVRTASLILSAVDCPYATGVAVLAGIGTAP